MHACTCLCSQALGQKDVMIVNNHDDTTANNHEDANNTCNASEAAVSSAVPKTSKPVASGTTVAKRLLFSWSELDNVRTVYAD
jgi:hypothetical protein